MASVVANQIPGEGGGETRFGIVMAKIPGNRDADTAQHHHPPSPQRKTGRSKTGPPSNRGWIAPAGIITGNGGSRDEPLRPVAIGARSTPPAGASAPNIGKHRGWPKRLFGDEEKTMNRELTGGKKKLRHASGQRWCRCRRIAGGAASKALITGRGGRRPTGSPLPPPAMLAGGRNRDEVAPQRQSASKIELWS